MPIDEAKERFLRERQAELTSLAKHPSWETLKEVFNEKKQVHLKTISADIIGTGVVDQGKLREIRGWWLGCSWLLANPDMAEKSLEKALAAAKLMEEDG